MRLGAYRARARPLDQVLATESFGVPVSKIVGVKIDVEGHEAPVARGAYGVLYRNKPLLMIEGALSNRPLMFEIYEFG